MIARLTQKLRNLVRGEVDRAKDELRHDLVRLREEVRFQGARTFLRDPLPADAPFDQVGYRVYSQFDEDGILQHLLRYVPIENDFFVEFGVQDYQEANTRFLLEYSNWRGLVLDPVPSRFLANSTLRSWHALDFQTAFVTRENVNELFAPYAGDMGVLSIDIDGVDYHVWEALKVLSPRIVVMEYQPNFGPEKRLTVPCSPTFDRSQHHFSKQCAGASLAALEALGRTKGYALVGTSRGPNAFFVREDVLGPLPRRAAAEVYREPRYCDAVDREGHPVFPRTLAERQALMQDAVVLNLETGQVETVGEAFRR